MGGLTEKCNVTPWVVRVDGELMGFITDLRIADNRVVTVERTVSVPRHPLFEKETS